VLEHHFDEPDPIAFVFKEPTMTINFLSDAGLSEVIPIERQKKEEQHTNISYRPYFGTVVTVLTLDILGAKLYIAAHSAARRAAVSVI